MFTSMINVSKNKIESQYLHNEHRVTYERIHIKFITGNLKTMELERQDIIQDFFSSISLLFGLLTVIMSFVFKKNKVCISILFISKKHTNWF